MSKHHPQIIAYLDVATGICECGYKTAAKFGYRRTADAKQDLMLHLEDSQEEYQIKNGDPLDCPLCRSALDLIEGDKGLLMENQPSVVMCFEGHEWDAYVKHKILFLFPLENNGPFSIW